MSQARQLRREIERCEIQHPLFLDQYKGLKQRIDDAIDNFASRIEWIVGPSRVGKTMLIGMLARDYPQQKIDGKRRVPVLVVTVPPNISPLLLPISVLLALGVPLPQRGATSGVMFNRMIEQLRLAGTRVILFEEASHLVEPGAKLPPRAAGDWFKSLADYLDLTIFLFGVPRLKDLFKGNERLRLRASAKREFRPYDSRKPHELKSFAACVRSYASLFEKYGWPIELPFDSLVLHCYLLSGGLVGVLSRFMQELAYQLTFEPPRPVTVADCAAVASAIEGVGWLVNPAFSKDAVSALELNSAHTHVLEANDMAQREESAPSGSPK